MHGGLPGVASAQEVQHANQLPDVPHREPRTQRDRKET